MGGALKSRTRIAVLGAGWWAVENHTPVLKSCENVDIVGICRIGQEELQRVQERFSIPFGTEDYKELLSFENLDGVVVSTPHYLHYEHSAAALEKGLHVMCEKPMALHAAEAKSLAGLARLRNRHLVIPYGWNYTRDAARARELIKKGEIGEIEHVLCHMASALRDLFSGSGAWFAEEAVFKPQLRTWSDPAVGGGFAHGQLTHALALLYWITDLQPDTVFCFSRTSKTGADIYDALSCRFANGATGMVGGAGTMPPKSTYQVDIRIFGSQGMMLLDIERPRLEVRRNDGRGKQVENCSTAALGAAVVATLEAAQRSANTGRVELAGNIARDT